MTGRVIDDQPTIDYILKLHNEVRSKIARGRCDQPKAGCMWPLVNINFDQIVFVEFCTTIIFQNFIKMGIFQSKLSILYINENYTAIHSYLQWCKKI